MTNLTVMTPLAEIRAVVEMPIDAIAKAYRDGGDLGNLGDVMIVPKGSDFPDPDGNAVLVDQTGHGAHLIWYKRPDYDGWLIHNE